MTITLNNDVSIIKVDEAWRIRKGTMYLGHYIDEVFKTVGGAVGYAVDNGLATVA